VASTVKTQARDTRPEIEEVLIEGYRRMPSAEKLRRVDDLNHAVEQMAAARIRRQYGPDLSERELRLRLAALRTARRTMIEAFDWDPEAEGY
jgi:hypothetical protein